MKKMNNKGFTIVEVIVCFILIMIIVTAMLKVAMSYRTTAQNKEIEEQLITYKNLLTKDVQKDIFEKGLINMEKCTSGEGRCVQLNFIDGTNKQFIVGNVDRSDRNSVINKYIRYGGIKYPMMKDDIPTNIPAGSNPGDYQSLYISTGEIFDSITLNTGSIYTIEFRIEHSDLNSDYGIHITTFVQQWKVKMLKYFKNVR